MTTAKATKADADEWMSVPQAEAALGDSRTKVLAAIVAGVLEGKHMAGRTFVRRETVEREIARRDAIVASD